ncbi:MAG: hypothetical protein ACOYB2_13185 [Limnohabitans sp.]
MNDFHKILQSATSCIDGHYFETNVLDKKNQSIKIYRERIYCYELYHQLRKKWPNNKTLILHGEFDKSGSQFFAGLSVNGAKPDFLIHTPGSTNTNLLAMEVKPITAQNHKIKSDLEKLTGMLTEAYFSHALFLIFGNGSKKKADQILSRKLEWQFDSKIEIWAHENAKEAATQAEGPK